MNWELKSDRPVYLQLVEQLQMAIISGQMPPGSRVLSVRELAAQAAVNPNTMQRALAELENLGLVQTHRTSGRCVTTDLDRLAAAKQSLAKQHLDSFATQMRLLGYSDTELTELIKSCLPAPAEKSSEPAISGTADDIIFLEDRSSASSTQTKEDTDGTDSGMS